ncbi:hypothetical protein, partial [Erwinia sp.]|uniref:hypothetical protein n=1 Tax=Erwinia citreus TaxID=558 RepID=UPI0028992862
RKEERKKGRKVVLMLFLVITLPIEHFFPVKFGKRICLLTRTMAVEKDNRLPVFQVNKKRVGTSIRLKK